MTNYVHFILYNTGLTDPKLNGNKRTLPDAKGKLNYNVES